MSIEGQEPQIPAKYPMLERGESITDFMARNDGSTFADYSNALRDHRLRLVGVAGNRLLNDLDTARLTELHVGNIEGLPSHIAVIGRPALRDIVEVAA